MATYIYGENVLRNATCTHAQALLIELNGPQIVNVQPLSRSAFSTYTFSSDDDVLDLGTYLVTPAFVNAHTHLAMSVFRGLQTDAFGGNVVEDLYYAVESSLTPEDVRAFSRYAAYESILTGTGLVWDHYYYAEALANGLADAGLPAVIAPTLQDLNGPGVETMDDQLQATLALDSVAWRDRGIFPALGPHATDTVSDRLWQTVSEIAKTRGLPIHAHAAQSPEEFERLIDRHGRSPIRFLDSVGVLDLPVPKLLVHGLYVSATDLRAMKDKDVTLGYCPYSQVQFGFPAQVQAWDDCGLAISIGTDCGASNDSMDVQQELRLAAGGYAFGLTTSTAVKTFSSTGKKDHAQSIETYRLQQRTYQQEKLTHEKLLDSVWRTPGRLHPRFRCGAIEASFLANLAIWDTHHPSLWPVHDVRRTLIMNSTAPALKGMILMGKQRGQLGDFQRSIMMEDGFVESQREAEERRKALLNRLR